MQWRPLLSPVFNLAELHVGGGYHFVLVALWDVDDVAEGGDDVDVDASA